MRIALSSQNFAAVGGTQTYVLTVAQQLERLGHETWISTRNAGRMAEVAVRDGVRVVDLGELPDELDAFFAQDTATHYELASKYPRAARIFVAHSADHALQGVPQLNGACDAVVVLNDRVRRWVQSHAAHLPVLRLRQPIDTWRFTVPRLSRGRPRRVLVSTNYVAGVRAQLIEDACEACGLEVGWLGATSTPTAHPENAIADADIVIGLGRTALEGMAAARATYIYGAMMGDGWVTPSSYPGLEADGFAGIATERVIDASQLATDLKQWHPEMGEANRDLAYTHHAARPHVIELLKLARKFNHAASDRPEGREGLSQADELARLVRLEWHMYGRAMRASREAEQARAELDRCRDELERTNARMQELADAHQQLAALTATRRYRFARSIAAPLDWIRSARGW
jgi:hypothetical protein